MRALALLVAVLLGTLVTCAGPREISSAADGYVDAEAIVCAYDWPCGEALSIVYRESRFDPHAYNAASGCAGWWQICPLHGYPLSTLFDPEANTRIAYGLWLASGWAPWRY